MTGAAHNKIAIKSLLAHDAVATSILKALAYFDIFHYPLSKEEIGQFLNQYTDQSCLEKTLQKLVDSEQVFIYHQFYSLHNNPLYACKRIQGNRRAHRLLPKAQRIGRFLYQFPFVRGIGISGSLSKNFADQKADIDFFIITKPNRLWIARTIMHLFKKLTFIFGRQHYYCMNYYVDEQALLLDEKNIFTAIEIRTLVPVSGTETINRFYSTNQWTDQWLPVCQWKPQEKKDAKASLFKKTGEWLFNNNLGDNIDNFFMRLTTRRWKRKEEKGARNKKGATMGLRTGKHFARSNPGHFQEKVLCCYKEKLTSLGIDMD
jgi:hypothetical protein